MTGLVDIVNLDQLLNHAEHQFYWLITGSPSNSSSSSYTLWTLF